MTIAREAARLAFVCTHGIGVLENPGTFEELVPSLAIDSDSSFEQEKAELLAGIREEVYRHCGTPLSDVRLHVCRDVLTHLAGLRAAPEGSRRIQ